MRRLFLRSFLGILILLNVWMIFGFSSEPATQSNQTSKIVTENLAQVVVKDYDSKTPEEQAVIVTQMHPSVRKLAHMTEFASLAFLTLLFVRTWKISALLSAAISLFSTLCVAICDELYQHFSKSGRAGQVKDVLFDMLGALIGCLTIFVLISLFRLYQKREAKKPLRVSAYTVQQDHLTKPIRIAVAADLHDNPYQRVIDALKREAPDLIFIPGDLTDDEKIRDGGKNALEFLKACANIAPTFYSLGNHEVACYHRGNPFRHPNPIPVEETFRQAVAQTGVRLLDNSGVQLGDLAIFGLTSGINGKKNEPDAEALKQFANMTGKLKLLLCHHPEYYMPYLQSTNADLVVCGHAHGGHWRIFGRGVYAPGQGLFPKYTSGVVDGRCVISRGIGNHTSIPRIFNPTELVVITLKGKE